MFRNVLYILTILMLQIVMYLVMCMTFFVICVFICILKMIVLCLKYDKVNIKFNNINIKLNSYILLDKLIFNLNLYSWWYRYLILNQDIWTCTCRLQYKSSKCVPNVSRMNEINPECIVFLPCHIM